MPWQCSVPGMPGRPVVPWHPGFSGTAAFNLAQRETMSAHDKAWAVPPDVSTFDLIGPSGPEHLVTALVKGYKPMATLGDRYSTIQVKLVEQSLPDDSRKPETAAPGGTRFANYAKSDIYFRCPAQLVETEVMRGKFDAPSVVG